MSILGNNIGFVETLELELKEFTLKKDPIMFFTEEEIETAISLGKIDQDKFNLMISDNIFHFFKYYLPKYLSVFGNSKLDNATLYMGVNDFGEITGVPFFGEITPDFLKSFLDCIKTFIKIDNVLDDIDSLISEIKFEVIKLDKNPDYLDNSIDKIIQEHNNKKTKYEKEYKENLAERIKWFQKMDYYISKIQDYATFKHYRIEVADYIDNNNFENDIEIKNISDLLRSDKLIDVGDGNEIRIRKDNRNDVVYWITQYKDLMIDKIKEKKPAKIQYCNFSQNIYMSQFILLSNLRQKFIENNKDINYYMIKINFPTKCSNKIYFRTHDFDTWHIRTRAIVNGSPGCILV